MAPMRAIARLVRLSATEWWLLCEATLAVTLVRLALLALTFGTILRLAKRVRLGAQHSNATTRIVWAVTAAARRVPTAWNCLVQALAGLVLLRHHGIAAELRLGVARGNDRAFEAHAWLESGGVVLIGARERARFHTLPTPQWRTP